MIAEESSNIASQPTLRNTRTYRTQVMSYLHSFFINSDEEDANERKNVTRSG